MGAATPGEGRLPSSLRIGLDGALIAAVVIAALVTVGGLDPVDLLFPGRQGHDGQVLVADFDEQIPDRHAYDGQDTYLFARSFPDITAASELNVAEFRLRRVLHPALAAIAPPGEATLLLLVIANLVGVALASGGLADLARAYGRDPRVGYAAIVALAFPLVITTTEPLAFGLGFVGLAAVQRNRYVPATVLFGLAGLTRETALVMAFAAGLTLVLRARWVAGPAIVVGAIAPLLAWSLYLRTVVPVDRYESSKLFGFLDASWTLSDALVCAGVVGLLLVGVWQWRREPLLSFTAVGFLGCCTLYIGDSFNPEGLTRVSAGGIAVGLAGLLAHSRRGPASDLPMEGDRMLR